MKVAVDADLCAGHGACTETCPQVFAIGPGGYAEVAAEDVPADLEDRVLQAADECPTQAIATDPEVSG